MSIDIEAISARVEAITPGRWEVKTNRHRECSGEEWGWIDGPTENWCWTDKRKYSRADADFIAHAPETIKALLAEVKRLQGELSSVTAERDALIEDFTDFACGGCANAAPYCANKSPECTDAHEWCIDEKCKGFRPSACGAGKEQKHG